MRLDFSFCCGCCTAPHENITEMQSGDKPKLLVTRMEIALCVTSSFDLTFSWVSVFPGFNSHHTDTSMSLIHKHLLFFSLKVLMCQVTSYIAEDQLFQWTEKVGYVYTIMHYLHCSVIHKVGIWRSLDWFSLLQTDGRFTIMHRFIISHPLSSTMRQHQVVHMIIILRIIVLYIIVNIA